MTRILVFVSLLIPALGMSQELHTFSNGQVADADKVNENFQRLKESMGSPKGCSARQSGSDVVINCEDGSFGIIAPGGGLIDIDPYQGEKPVFLDCNDVGDFVETAINLRVNDGNFLGFISASEFPSMNRNAEQTLKNFLISVFSFDVFTASYTNKYLARWATDKAIKEIRRNTLKSCTDGWFERLESSELAYDQDLSGNPLRVLQITITGSGLVTSFPAGANCSSDCEVNFPVEAEIILRAQPDNGYSFSHWSGDCSGEKTSCQMVISADTSVIAEFTEAPWTSLIDFSIPSLEADEGSDIFEFYLPNDASFLEVEMSGGGNGDADLYVTSQTFWDMNGYWQCVPQMDGSQESCTTEDLQPLYQGGRYLVGVYGYTPVSDISISVKVR